jgi:hypothetical protein
MFAGINGGCDMRTWAPGIALAACLTGCALTSSGAESATLTGKVEDASGKPVEHATVMVYEAGVKHGYSVYCPSCWPDCGKRAVTDSGGQFRIGGLNPELVFTLLVIQDGYSATYVKKADPSGGPVATAVLKVRVPPENPAQTVRGLVVDSRGNPAADAVVEQQGVTYVDDHGRKLSSFGALNWIDLMAVTNAKGEFEIAYSMPAEKMILSVSARGMAPKLFTETTGLDRKTLTVASGSTIRGRLVQDGKPVANAEIGLTTHERRSGTTFSEMIVGTREDGTFDLTNVPAGRVWILYGKMESLAARGVAAELVECETKDDGQLVDIGDVQVKSGFTLHGKVVLSGGNAIPPDTRITLSADRAWDTQMSVLAPDGSFEFKGLAKGVYSLGAGLKNYRLPDEATGEVLVNRNVDGVTIALQPTPPRK